MASGPYFVNGNANQWPWNMRHVTIADMLHVTCINSQNRFQHPKRVAKSLAG